MRNSLLAALGVVTISLAAALSAPASAQPASKDWFMPGGSSGAHPAAAPRAAAPGPRATPASQPGGEPGPLAQDGPDQGGGSPGGDNGQPPRLNVQLPPAPALPPVAKGSSPPAAVMGVLSVPDVMRASTAAQQMQKVLGARSRKLNEDAQKEQAAWREMNQQLAAQRTSLTEPQLRAKEQTLQQRVTAAQRTFRERDQVIKEAAQYGLLQIERTLSAVIQQVAGSRNMNMVLHREQVMLNTPEFDLTEQVAVELNKVLPSVEIPPDGVRPEAFAAKLAKQEPAPQPGALTVQPQPAPVAKPKAHH